MVTSSVSGEGKTFCSINVATVFALSGKKTILVGLDLRKPKIFGDFDLKNDVGIVNYLIGQATKEEIIQNTHIENLDLISAGPIPPNPSELWRSKKTPSLFAELESMYDYVVVDTAPSLLVTDTFLINHYADLTLYVSRAGYTEKKLIQFAVDAKNEGKIKNISFVLNAVKTANFGYGNKYGYAYGEEETGFWNKVKDKVAFW